MACARNTRAVAAAHHQRRCDPRTNHSTLQGGPPANQCTPALRCRTRGALRAWRWRAAWRRGRWGSGRATRARQPASASRCGGTAQRARGWGAKRDGTRRHRRALAPPAPHSPPPTPRSRRAGRAPGALLHPLALPAQPHAHRDPGAAAQGVRVGGPHAPRLLSPPYIPSSLCPSPSPSPPRRCASRWT